MTQEEIHTELSGLLSRNLEDIEVLLALNQTLSREIIALLNSRRWAVGSRLLFRRSAHRVQATEAAQKTADESSEWLLRQRPPFDAVQVSHATRLVENTLSILPLAIAVRESSYTLAHVAGALEEQRLLAEKIRYSFAWRLGDLLVNRIAKTLLRKPNQDTRWAPHIIDEIALNAEDLARNHDARARELEALLGECVQSRHLSREEYETKALSDFPEMMNASPTLFSLELEPTDRSISIIVPVFNAPAETRLCIESLLRHTAQQHPILLINDASTDQQIRPMLEEFAAKHDQIQAIHSESNAGFPATVNKGFDMTTGDVIVLNSDTVVTPRWIEKLEDTTYSRDNVATVTPLTNSGGAFSVPKRDASNDLPDFLTIDMAADVLERLSRRLRPEVPTAMGYCMYIRRAALDAAGHFDAERFREGYGEENDFCMRAEKKGFVHLIDDATFIYHAEGASFQDASARYKKRAAELIDESYPDYRERINDWTTNDPLDLLRMAIKAVWDGHLAMPIDTYLTPDSRATLMQVVHDGQGGTFQHVDDLMRGMTDDYRCILLRAGQNSWTIQVFRNEQYATVDTFHFEQPWDIKSTLNDEKLNALRDIVEHYKVDIAHIQHLIFSAPEIIPALKRLGCAVVYSQHDFYAICPSFKLLDQDLLYCEGTCTPGNGTCSIDIEGVKIPDLKHGYVQDWRDRTQSCMADCNRIVSFGSYTQELMLRNMPDLDRTRFETIPHGQDLSGFSAPTSMSLPDHAIKVVLIGTLSPAKGSSLVEEVLALNFAQSGPFEFHFVGIPHLNCDPSEYGAVVHGAYAREDLPGIVSGINPSFGMIASIWPETFCYALSECWAAGLPVFASDIGVLRERLSVTGGGWLLDHSDSDRWYAEMCRVAQSTDEYAEKLLLVREMHLRTPDKMLADYRRVYEGLVSVNPA